MWQQQALRKTTQTLAAPTPSSRLLDPTEAWQALPAIQQAQAPQAWLALNQDKHVLLAPAASGLLQFARRSKYWIALGEASGTRHARIDLETDFLRRAALAEATAVIYQADAASAERYRASGWRTYALGEEARVPLPNFSLDGAERKSIRQNVRKIEREGVRFELAASADARLIAQCLAVSDAWLASRRSGEKGFSLGKASAEYLAAMPLALVWQDGRLLAFANVLQSADRSVLSVDLMRHLPDAPRGCMDFLFAQLMLWGRSQGYGYFSLGMAPLTGAATEHGSRHWPAVLRLIRRFGERYYSFAGLRRFKQKWQPEWTPRYLVVPRRRDLAPALLECALTIAGSKRALLGRGPRTPRQAVAARLRDDCA